LSSMRYILNFAIEGETRVRSFCPSVHGIDQQLMVHFDHNILETIG
jgi:hypothetical protein